MSEQAPLRVLIAEDDPVVRGALTDLIDGEPSFELVGAAADAPEAIALAMSERPDVALVDVRMPGGGGVTAARGIGRHSPTTKVIALSGQADRATVLQMLEAGVVGYLLKGTSVSEIVEAVKRAPAGQSTLSIELTGAIIQELAGQLTLRTRQRKQHDTLERRIQRAMHNEDALTMVFQPIVGLRDRVTVGVEALARFAGPPQRSPGLWFVEAAAVGLREELELHAVSKTIAALPELPPDIYLTFNVSPLTLTGTRFLKLVSAADAARLVAEITEHAPIQNYTRLGETLATLRKLGMRLAIDDAGAGYSSLRHILELRPQMIKLDLSLIRDIHSDRSKQALAAGLISFADKAGSIIVAEGVELAAEAETLAELGVSHAQGYLFGKPTPLPLPQTGEQVARAARFDRHERGS